MVYCHKHLSNSSNEKKKDSWRTSVATAAIVVVTVVVVAIFPTTSSSRGGSVGICIGGRHHLVVCLFGMVCCIPGIVLVFIFSREENESAAVGDPIRHVNHSLDASTQQTLFRSYR